MNICETGNRTAYLRQWRLKNKKHKAAYQKLWYKDHSEYYSQWRQDNPEYDSEYQKVYNKTPAGRARIKAGKHNRRALTKGLTKATVQRVYEDNIKQFGTLTCYLCNKPIAFGEDSVDHAIPLSRGGNNDYDNLKIAHLVCNKRKGIKTFEEWFSKQVLSGNSVKSLVASL